MTRRYLIVNADDFGWTEGINNGIIEAADNGIVTSATLLANMPASEHAVRLARQRPHLGVGVHLNYHLGPPVRPHCRLDLLFDGQGRRKLGTLRLLAEVTLRPRAYRQLYRHFHWQIAWVRDHGLPITHLDTHKHLHAWPVIARMVADLAGEFGIRCIRVIRENPLQPGPVAPLARAAVAAIEATGVLMDQRLVQAQVSAADRFVGIVQTGHWTTQRLLTILKSLPPGVTELMVHPGFAAGLENEPTRLIESRQRELQVCCEARVKQLCSRWNIELIHYGHVPALRARA